MNQIFQKNLICLFFLLMGCFSLFGEMQHADFVVMAPPKCGTHLIGKTLGIMLNKEVTYYLEEELNGDVETCFQLIETNKQQNKIVVAHNYSPGLVSKLLQNHYKIIFILRDPRDQLISLIHHFKKGQWFWLKVSQMQDINEQIDELITGSRFGYKAYEKCIGNRFKKVEKLSSRIVHVTRFESLVGPQGLGSEKEQIEELLNIAKFIHFKLSVDDAKNVGKNSFGGTWSFREGKIGEWKKYFTPEHKETYKAHYGKILIHLGYESNYKW